MRIGDAYRSRKTSMLDNWLPLALFVGLVGVWFVMNRWILPKMGIST
jgi:hypothetical protein